VYNPRHLSVGLHRRLGRGHRVRKIPSRQSARYPGGDGAPKRLEKKRTYDAESLTM
jgi:hypothetical protein